MDYMPIDQPTVTDDAILTDATSGPWTSFPDCPSGESLDPHPLAATLNATTTIPLTTVLFVMSILPIKWLFLLQ